MCNDKRYIYRRKVIDDEIVTLDLAWSECRSMSLLDEFRQIQTSLRNTNAKVSTTEDALKNANAKLSTTEDALKNANAKLSTTEDTLKNSNAKVNATESDLKNANSMIASSQKKLLVVGEDNKRLKAQIKRRKKTLRKRSLS